MLAWFRSLFDTSALSARWADTSWSSADVGLHITSDLTLWGACTAISAALVWLLLKHRQHPFLPILWLLAALLFLCGVTHLLDAALFYWPTWRFAGIGKALTTMLSS